METEPLLIGFMFMVLGGLIVIRPDFLIRLQVWTQRVIMGAQYIPSARTYTVVRIMGAFFVVIGLSVVSGLWGVK